MEAAAIAAVGFAGKLHSPRAWFRPASQGAKPMAVCSVTVVPVPSNDVAKTECTHVVS